MNNITEQYFACKRCRKWIKYHHMTKEQAEQIHSLQCKNEEIPDIDSEFDFDLDSLVCSDLTLEQLGLIKYLQSKEYEETQTWNPDENWCRYCGARASSAWQKSPWGPHYFCTVHYVQWRSKKNLNIDHIKELPTRPINISANSEGGYLLRMYKKYYNNMFPTLGELIDPNYNKVEEEENENEIETKSENDNDEKDSINQQKRLDDEEESKQDENNSTVQKKRIYEEDQSSSHSDKN